MASSRDGKDAQGGLFINMQANLTLMVGVRTLLNCDPTSREGRESREILL